MLRQENTRSLHWADKTMSVLRANQLEACEKELASFPSCGLFDDRCSDLEAEELFSSSFYAREERTPRLHTAEDLRLRVLAAFPAELALLSEEEHQLLVRLILFGGSLALRDWNDMAPARDLQRRLWCSVEQGHPVSVLHLPHQLLAVAAVLLASEEHEKLRETVKSVVERVDNTLYLIGVMRADAPARDLEARLKGTLAGDHPELVMRLLMSAFDYVYDRQSHLLLIHPGLAEPDRLNLASLYDRHFLSLDDQSLTDVSERLNDMEMQNFEPLEASLTGFTRPEISPTEAVEDLIVLVKQDVPFPDMVEVLSSMLIGLPKPGMIQALRNLYDHVPRWFTLSSSVVQ